MATKKAKIKSAFDSKDFTSSRIVSIFSVHDGDTVGCNIVHSKHNVETNVYLRLIGIDSPEHGKDEPYASLSRDHLTTLLTGQDSSLFLLNSNGTRLLPKPVQILARLGDEDDKGRTLAYLYANSQEFLIFNGVSTNQQMIIDKFAVAYDGVGKRPVTDWPSIFGTK